MRRLSRTYRGGHDRTVSRGRRILGIDRARFRCRRLDGERPGRADAAHRRPPCRWNGGLWRPRVPGRVLRARTCGHHRPTVRRRRARRTVSDDHLSGIQHVAGPLWGRHFGCQSRGRWLGDRFGNVVGTAPPLAPRPSVDAGVLRETAHLGRSRAPSGRLPAEFRGRPLARICAGPTSRKCPARATVPHTGRNGSHRADVPRRSGRRRHRDLRSPPPPVPDVRASAPGGNGNGGSWWMPSESGTGPTGGSTPATPGRDR